MTITELSKELNVTQQAVYQKLKRRGISLESIQRGGSLTEDGIKTVRSLYEQNRQDQLSENMRDQIKCLEELNEYRLKLNDAEHKIKELQSKLDLMTVEQARASHDQEVRETESAQTIASMRDTIRNLEQDKGYLQAALCQEKETHRQALLLLSPPKREGLLTRIQKLFKGE